VHLVLLARALPDQLCAAGDTAPEHPRWLVDDPHLGQEAAGEQLRQRARVDLVRLRRLRYALDRLRVGQQDAIDVRLDDPRDREPVAARLQRHPVARGKAAREQLERLRLSLDSAGKPHLTRLGDRDFAKVAMDVERDKAHLSSSRSPADRAEAGNTTTTDPCSRHIRAVAGAANYNSRARSP